MSNRKIPRTTEVRMAELRAEGFRISRNGRELPPGSAEYERELRLLVESTTEEELVLRSKRPSNE